MLPAFGAFMYLLYELADFHEVMYEHRFINPSTNLALFISYHQ
jgi:hypothetical protein